MFTAIHSAGGVENKPANSIPYFMEHKQHGFPIQPDARC